MNLKRISICHVEGFWAVCRLNTAAVEEETNGSGSFALSLAEGIHQFLQSSSPLDLEEDLVVVVGNLNVEMLTLASSLRLLGGTWAAVVV